MEIQSTEPVILFDMYELAKNYLDFVYIGNLSTNKGQNTYCNKCDNLLIKRNGYNTSKIGLDEMGNCLNCNSKIIEHI